MYWSRGVALSLLLLPAVAAGPDAQADDQPTLVVLEEDEPQSPWPVMARTMSEQRLAELLFDRFFIATPGGDVESRIFTPGWRSRPPNLGVGVRDGLKFSNGSGVTFSDIAFTLNDVYRRDNVGHDGAAWYARVFGDAQQITPLNGSFRFLVSMPEEGAERYLTTTALYSAESLGGAGKVNLDAAKRQPVGTGPFFAARPIENFDDVVLIRNPHRAKNSSTPLAGGQTTPVGALRLLYDQDAARQKELMAGGRADLWVSPPAAVLPEFSAQGDRFNTRRYDLSQWWYIAVNPAHPDLSKPAVRLALDLAVPRPDLVQKFGGDAAAPTSGPFLGESAWLPSDVTPTATDRALAEATMKGEGYRREGTSWVGPDGPMTLRFAVQDSILDDYNDVVYGLVDGWEAAGFAVRLRGIRESDWRTVVEAGKAAENWDIVLGRWNVDREEGVLDLFTSSGDRRRRIFPYKNTAVDEIVQKFYAETSGPAREALMQKLHRTLHEDRPYLFLWSLQVKSVYRKDRIAGFKPRAFYYFTEAEALVWTAGAAPAQP
jgi:ABC-type transport system substrate-binding protein